VPDDITQVMYHNADLHRNVTMYMGCLGLQDSFKSCTTFTAAVHVLQILVPDLLARLQEDFEVSGKAGLLNSTRLMCQTCYSQVLFLSLLFHISATLASGPEVKLCIHVLRSTSGAQEL
jgi:hypothetical protein